MSAKRVVMVAGLLVASTGCAGGQNDLENADGSAPYAIGGEAGRGSDGGPSGPLVPSGTDAPSPSGTDGASDVAASSCATAPYRVKVESLPGLVSYWRLDETTGTTAKDLHGTNDGTYTSATLGQTSLLSTDPDPAIALDGMTGYVDVPPASTLNIAAAITLGAVIKPIAVDGKRQILTKENAYWIQVDGGGLEFAFVDAGQTVHALEITGGIDAGAVAYVVGTYDGQTMRVYINGAEVGSQAQTGAIASASNDLHLGSWSGHSNFFDGVIDEAFVANQAISAANVSALYDAGTGCVQAGTLDAGGADGGEADATDHQDGGHAQDSGRKDGGVVAADGGLLATIAIGVNDGNGWGPAVASYFYNDDIHWDRVGAEGGDTGAGDDALAAGWSIFVIVDASQSTAVATMQHFAYYGSRVVFEYTNEPWETSISPGTYAQNYMAVRSGKIAAGVTQPLCFQTVGSGGYATANGQMWIDRALATVPTLQVDEFSAHPYGQVDENTDGDSYGVAALIADQAYTATVAGGRFASTQWWVSEFGFTLNPDNNDGGDNATAQGWYVPSYAEQANQLNLAYTKFLTLPWLAGVLWYQTHDDSTGWFGLVTAPTPESTDYAGEPTGADSSAAPTPVNPRTSYNAFVGIIQQVKAEGRLR